MKNILSRVGVVLVCAAALAMTNCGWGGDPSDFRVTVDNASIKVMADYTTPAITLHVQAVDAYFATVAFTAVPAPGFTCNPTCTATTTSEGLGLSSVVFHFDTAPNLVGSTTYPIVFRALEGKIEHDVTVQVAVTSFDGNPPPPDFDFTVDPAIYDALITPGKFYDDIRYTFTFTRYNHYTGPISVMAILMDTDTFCGTVPCSFVDTASVAQPPFVISTDTTTGAHTILFTASVAPNVTKTTTAQIVVIMIPPPPRPPLPGGNGG